MLISVILAYFPQSKIAVASSALVLCVLLSFSPFYALDIMNYELRHDMVSLTLSKCRTLSNLFN